MNIIDRLTINRFHDDLTREYGNGTAGALGWVNTESQLTRFEVLSSLGNCDNRTVLDVGCGHGDLYPFLKAKYPALMYAGIDNNASFLDIALERYGDKEQATFLLGDFTSADLPPADYVFCCGALSYYNQETDFIKNSIEKLFQTSRHGFGFNLLRKVKNPGSILVAYNPDDILAICRSLTTNIKLQEDYLPEDFTFFLYH
jgi:SAM-dependent methyltransferase